MPHHGVDFDRLGPVNDNRPAVIGRAEQASGMKSKDGRVLAAAESMPSRMSSYPQATGLPGSLMIIENAGHGGHRREGIPGILTTTSLEPGQRRRLMEGIIDLSEHGRSGDGPLHYMTGHDATAHNEGMRPIPGAAVHSREHHKKEHHGTVKGEMRKTSRRAYEH